MTLEEAIRHCEEVAERYETRAKIIDRRKLGFALENPTACHECAADHRQLAEWLRELREAKRLLKLAVEGFKSRDVVISHPCSLCKYGGDPVEMCQSRPRECFEWVYTEEAAKLLAERRKNK